jgi:hypothetical protein
MESLEYRLDFCVNKAVDAYIKSRKEQDQPILPIDVAVLAREIGGIDVEFREMIPEAAVQVEGERFRICLQRNFVDRPGALRRQRFSLAHEIAHTFFFERKDGSLRPIKGAPRGLQLEKACHRGAGMLLLPDRFLERELKKVDKRIHTAQILKWSKSFDVSVEVLLRRLESAGALESDDVSFALVNDGRIKFVSYPPWLKPILPLPVKDIRIEQWLSACGGTLRLMEDGGYQLAVGDLVLIANAARLSSMRLLFELRIADRNAQLKLSV